MGKAQEWSTRMAHEASMHDRNSFVTLTYSDEHLPSDWSVSIREMQLFMKRLRKSLGHGRVRFLACGEYGKRFNRPHYHVMLFGYEPDDRYPWRRTKSGHVLTRSPSLEAIWGKGHTELGTVTPQSAGYVARYCLKKVNGDRAAEVYRRIESNDFGEIIREWQVQPEFIAMSRKPGLGLGWYDQYASDCFPSDFVVIDGRKRPIPDYYLRKLKQREDKLFGLSFEVKSARIERASEHLDNNTPERLAVREELATLRGERLARDLESET